MTTDYHNTPHDSAFKGFMSKVGNARDFFDIHLPKNIKQLCDFNTLQLTNSSFIDHKLRSRLSDVLYSIETHHGDGYIYVLVEHQSVPDKLMTWRLMHYAFLAMSQHLQQGHKTLPFVVPMLFYNGKITPYPYSQMWTHCFQFPELANELYFNPLPLIDITVIDDNELLKHRKIAVMELAMKHKDLRDDVNQIIANLAQAINQDYNDEDDIDKIFYYWFYTIDSHSFTQIIKQLTNQIHNHQGTIMNIALRLQDQGRKKGHKEGHKEGRESTQLEIAAKLLKSGISLELIMESTNLSKDQIRQLQ